MVAGGSSTIIAHISATCGAQTKGINVIPTPLGGTPLLGLGVAHSLTLRTITYDTAFYRYFLVTF